MGYLTCFDFELIEGDEKEFQEFLNELAEDSGYIGIKEGYLYDAKWYDWEKDVLNASKRFPNIYFVIFGDGENVDDVWRYYCCNGKYKFTEMVWPKITKDDLE